MRKYYEQDYIDPLSKGDIWASMAWSGDIFQANASGATLEFVVPKEGAPIWTDNMCIPEHAAHPRDAMTYMDFVYEPEDRRDDRRLRQLHHPGSRRHRPIFKKRAEQATGDDKTATRGPLDQPAGLPARGRLRQAAPVPRLTTAEQEQSGTRIFEPIYQS